jgi:4-hydroxy-4-methyl-2-oxoglutarate aldolase
MGALEDKKMVVRHPSQGLIVSRIERPDRQLVERFRGFYTAIILDHLGKFGAMDMRIKPLVPGMRMFGPAVTALGPDLTVRRMAIDLAEPGDILVVAAGGVADYACFGDGTARRMQVKGLEGAVIDGSTRDSAGLRRLGFPTFARGITPRNYHYPMGGDYGAVNVPVVCGNTVVNPGDLICGDDDGVVVVPRDVGASIVDLVQEHLDAETATRSAWTEYEPFDVLDELVARGYRVD